MSFIIFNTNLLGAFVIGSLITYMATDNQKCTNARPITKMSSVTRKVPTKFNTVNQLKVKQTKKQERLSNPDASANQSDEDAKKAAKKQLRVEAAEAAAGAEVKQSDEDAKKAA